MSVPLGLGLQAVVNHLAYGVKINLWSAPRLALTAEPFSTLHSRHHQGKLLLITEIGFTLASGNMALSLAQIIIPRQSNSLQFSLIGQSY